MANEEMDLDREAERQGIINDLLQEFQCAVDWKYIDGDTVQVMHSRETPLERASIKLQEADWEMLAAGHDDDSHRRFDWFTFRLPDSLRS